MLSMNVKELTEEAINLMQLLGFSPEIISEYSLNRRVLMSGDGHAPAPLDNATQAEVAAFEKEHHAVVYSVVYGTLDGTGPNKSFLHVSSKGSPDFPLLETAARRGSAYAHIVNMLYPQDTKSGYISIRHEPYPVRVN